MTSGKKGVFSITSLLLVVQIAQMEMGKMICHDMSEKRDVVVCLKDMFLIQDKVVFDEKRRWGGGMILDQIGVMAG